MHLQPIGFLNVSPVGLVLRRGLLQPVYTRLYCALWWTAASPALWVGQASHLVALRWGLEAGYAEKEG